MNCRLAVSFLMFVELLAHEDLFAPKVFNGLLNHAAQ